MQGSGYPSISWPGGLGYAIILWLCYVKFYVYSKWNIVTASVTVYRYEVCGGVWWCVMARCVVVCNGEVCNGVWW